MNCFHLVKEVLDETYAAIPGSKAQKDDAIKKALKALSEGYADLKGGVNFSYKSPAVRFAYVYRYVTSHTCIVYESIRDSAELRSLFERDKVQVSCVGGGPGSDFLGILKYLVEKDLSPRARFTVFDRERAWANTWDYVEDKIGMALPLSTNYCQLDVAKKATWEQYDKFLQSDLFTMIYFMSEVWGERVGSKPFFDYLFTCAKPGALLLYVDNRDSEFAGEFDGYATGSGWEMLERASYNMTLPYNEEKDDLGEYLTMFGGWPKLTAKVDFRIIQKS
jgi:hypothetical protein